MKSDMAVNKRRILRADQDQVPHHNKEIVSFVVLLIRGVLVLLLVKRVVIAREKTILLPCAKRNCKILAGKQGIPWLKKFIEETDDSDTGADLLTFSVESSSEFPRQDDRLVTLKIVQM